MRRVLINAVEGVCGNNCVWCYKNKLAPQPFLPYEDIVAFLNNNSGEIDDILFMGVGESLDHPDFLKIVREIASRGIQLPQFNTSLLPAQRYLEPEMIEAILHFNNVNIEAGALSKTGKTLNMGRDSMWSFKSNLRNLCKAAEDKKIRITVKIILNKNNYKDFAERLPNWKAAFPMVNFTTQPLQVFDEDYFKYIVHEPDPKRARDEFIAANFDEHFPFIESNCTRKEYDEFRHTFNGAWFIGVDGFLYTCQNMAQMKLEEYKLGHIRYTKLKDVVNTDKFRLITTRMKNCCATPLCSKYCPI